MTKRRNRFRLETFVVVGGRCTWLCTEADCGDGEQDAFGSRGRQNAYNHAIRKGHGVEVETCRLATYKPVPA